MVSKILVLEDEESIRDFIVINLRRAGYKVIEASTATKAIEYIEDNGDGISVAILDIMLPDFDGNTVLEFIRGKDPKIGIIMLTAKGQEMDKILSLSKGADDYITKPFSPTELVARVDSLNRRVSLVKVANESILISGPFKLVLRDRKFFKEGNEVELTGIEFQLIQLFLKNTDKSLSRDEIFDEVWGENFLGNWKTVDVNIRRLRQKIEQNPSNPQYIKTIWGYGYKWSSSDERY